MADNKHFNGRVREGARLLYHMEYGAYIPAMIRSGEKFEALQFTAEELQKIDKVVAWMVEQVKLKGRWF